MNKINSSTIGWVALGTGIAIVIAASALAMMFTVGMFFGAVNDVFNGILGIASAVLAWLLYAEHRAKAPLISRIALALALVGAIVNIVGSVLILFDFTGFLLAGLYSCLGNAFIGVWLVAFCYAMQPSDRFPRSLISFGLVAGAVMALGLIGIPGILARVDDMAFLPWYLYLALFGWLGTYVLYPIWTIWLGRHLLSK